MMWGICNTPNPARAAPILKQAKELLTPPGDAEEVQGLANCATALGHVLVEMEWLEEAASGYREAMALKPGIATHVNALVGLARANVKMGRLEEAREQAQAAEAMAEKFRHHLDVNSQATVLRVSADVCEALGEEEKGWALHERANTLTRSHGGRLTNQDLRREEGRRAQRLLRDGRVKEAEAALEPRQLPLEYARRMEQGLLMTTGMDLYIQNMRLLAEIYGRQGQQHEAARITADVGETEAIVEASKKATLAELLVELRAEREGAGGAGAGGGAGSGSGGGGGSKKKKKLTRKQQKRNAAQRRKAAARAAAAERVGAEDEKEGGGGGGGGGGGSGDDALEAALEELELEEPESNPEPEPEECAICLGDLPAADEEGGVLLACSHTFHADCLARWKGKCLDKGIPFTCALCRGPAVGAAAAGGAAPNYS
jgi:tetratricopeptide (TPR) repeat protein